MSNSFWNIHRIVSWLELDKLQPIWSECVTFHENLTKILKTTALLRKCTDFFPTRLFSRIWLIMTDQAHRCAKKDCCLAHSDQINHIWKFQSDSKILKNSPLEGGRDGSPSGRGGRPTQALREDAFFKNLRIALKLSDMINSIRMSKKTIFFSRIDALGQWWEAIMRQIREKSLVGKKFDTLS